MRTRLRISLALVWLSAFSALPLPGGAQEPGAGFASVVGRVTDAETGRPLETVLVEVEGIELRVLTDSAGFYRFLRVPTGPQVLRAEMISYAVLRVPVTVPTSGVMERDLRLAPSALAIEGIVVTADPAGRAKGELGTASVIGRDAVAHHPTTTLAGVLSLVPGVAMSPPGLESKQIALRSTATSNLESRDLAAFGTLIILDGVPLSNNANLQSAPSGVHGLLGTSRGGIDLNRLPASTIERVEVIRGVPSARYGDLTQGAILVDTRAGVVDAEAGVQFDSRTLNGSFVAGREFFGEHLGTAALDVTRYEVSPGITNDQAMRFSLQLAHRFGMGFEDEDGERRLVMDTRLDVFQLREERALREEEPNLFTSWSRDRGFRISNRSSFRLGGSARLHLTASAEHIRQRSYWQSTQTSGAVPFTDRLTEGRAEGRFIAGEYLSQLDLEGDPWLAYGRLEAEIPGRWLGLDHEIKLGAELRREWNAGPGYRFAIDRPPQISFNGVDGFDRPWPFDQIPALTTTALYVDDRMSRSLPGDMVFRLQSGVRLDVLHEGGGWTSGARDVEVQPRLNAELVATPWLILRGGWGRVAKSPSLRHLYPAPVYYDLVNVNWFANDPDERLAVLTTFIEDPTNPDLGFSVSEKAELGVEMGIGASAVSLVAYREDVRGAVAMHPEPGFLLRDRYALETTGPGQPPTVIEPPEGADTIPVLVERPTNNTRIKTRGIELTALLPEIRPLSTRLQLQAAWTETEQMKADNEFGGGIRFGDFQLSPAQERIPYWDARVRGGRSLMAIYRLIHQQPELGLVITGWLQHNVSDLVWDDAATDTLSFSGYLTRDGQLVPIPPEERGSPEYADLHRQRTGLLVDLRTTPADWMMGIQVSKTLPLAGRLSFWAFNALDRRGSYIEVDVHPRLYPARRFGLEVTVPAGAFLGGGW